MSDRPTQLEDLDPALRARVVSQVIATVSGAARIASLEILEKGLGIGFAAISRSEAPDAPIEGIVIVTLDPDRAMELLTLIRGLPGPNNENVIPVDG